jgi:branched-chain amino acid transport system substrate-binding protein
MSRSRFRTVGLALVAVISLVGVNGLRAGAQQQFPHVDQPGVTDTEIHVGGVTTASMDPTGNTFGDAFDGVKAYFAYINSTQHGIYGRKLVLTSKRDDQLTNNRTQVQGLLGDNVFAVLPVAVVLFTGADLLVKSNIPTFGWDIQAEWGSEDNKPGPPNLFAAAGSYLCFTCGNPSPALYLAKKLHLTRAGTLAYNVPQSAVCTVGVQNGFKRYPVGKLLFADKTLPFGGVDYSAQVAKMLDDKVNYILPCIDANGAINLAREMQKQGLKAVQYLPNAYNHALVKKNAQFLNGDYVLTFFAPFETRPKPPGLTLFEKWAKKTGGSSSENAIFGWINADQFVAGLKAAGPNFTRQKLIDAVNAMTNYTAMGLVPPVNWTVAHSRPQPCGALVKVVNGSFKPVFAKPGKPFICFPDTLKTIPDNPVQAG